ncbi:MAG TPA: Ig-like domain-containing protein [Burkholderiaceae bacterium]|nr:Ig-like domain-containing protein [Burkholderiaceae bacterium]
MFTLMQNAARTARLSHARASVATVLLVVGLAACGGGGGGSESTNAQGASSTSTNAQTFAVSRIEPPNGATDVVPERLLSVQLSREPDPASVNDETIEVNGVEGRIPGKITVEGARILFRPSDALTFSSEYRFTIKSSVKDRGGNALGTPAESVFKIREAALTNIVNIDNGASGEPRQVKVARSATGDAFAVWRAYDGVRHNLWANHYDPAKNAWGPATLIETTYLEIANFELGADAKGGAMVLWRQGGFFATGEVVALRYNPTTKQWQTTPKNVSDGVDARLAVDANGNALAVWPSPIRGRYYDAQLDQWQPVARVEVNNTGTGFSFSPTVVFDASGNAFSAFGNGRSGPASIAVGNFFDGATKAWDSGPENFTGILYGVPDSFVSGSNDNFQLSADKRGNFFVVWEAVEFGSEPGTDRTTLRASRFSSATKAWLPAKDIVLPSPELDVRLQRAITDDNGRAIVLWTQTEGGRTALKSLIVQIDDLSTSYRLTVDGRAGGGASEADFGFTRCATAMSVWLQNEGGRPGDGSRTNVYFSRYNYVNGPGAWGTAMPIEDQPGNTRSPDFVMAPNGRAHVVWIQSDAGVYRVKELRLF